MEVRMPSTPTLEEDLRAIEALHEHDVEAVLSGDPMALIQQWTEDLVAIPPAGPILRGRAAYAAVAERAAEARWCRMPAN
jgi:ketosteroid isomerase-like protein